jgi:hypothetical protein
MVVGGGWEVRYGCRAWSWTRTRHTRWWLLSRLWYWVGLRPRRIGAKGICETTQCLEGAIYRRFQQARPPWMYITVEGRPE